MISNHDLETICFCCLSLPFLQYVAALPCSFGSPQNFIRQELTDSISDLIKLNPETSAQSNDLSDTIVRSSTNDSIDIELVTYSSDGEILNATLWLKDFRPEPLVDLVEYGMFIDVNTDNKSDYQVTVSWDGGNREWHRTLKEWTSSGDSSVSGRTLEEYDITKSLTSGDHGQYVNLYLLTSSIRSPDHVDAVFYANYLENGFGQIDPTSLVRIPPPEVIITPASNPVYVRPGEEKSVSLKIESTPGIEPIVYLSVNSTSDLRIGFRDNDNQFNSTKKIQVPFSGTTAVPLVLVTSKYAIPATLVKPVSVDIVYPFIVDRLCECWKVGEAAETNQANYSTSIAKQQFNLLIEVQPPLTASDHLNNFWKGWGESLTGFYSLLAAAAGGVSVLIAKRFKKGQ
jgi:hypothetical protein